MWPVLFESPPGLDLPPAAPYGMMVLLGVVAGQALALELAARMGIDRMRLAIASVVAVVTGFVGAKVLYIVATGNPFSLTGGFAFYGGAIAGGLGLVAATLALKLPTWKVLDLAAPVLVLGHGIGRFGCFFAGCCHGVPVPHAEPAVGLLPEGLLHGQVWWHPHAPFLSNTFEAGVARWLGVPLYPTQLWLAFGNLALFGLLWWVWRTRRFDGQVAALALCTEPVLRALVEIYRGDHRGYAVQWSASGGWGTGAAGSGLDEAVVGITTSQGIAMALVVIGLAIGWARRGAGVAEEVPLDPDADPFLDG